MIMDVGENQIDNDHHCNPDALDENYHCNPDCSDYGDYHCNPDDDDDEQAAEWSCVLLQPTSAAPKTNQPTKNTPKKIPNQQKTH